MNGLVLTVLTLKARVWTFGEVRIWYEASVIVSWRRTGNATRHYLSDCQRIRGSQSAVFASTCMWIFSTAASRGIVESWSGRREVEVVDDWRRRQVEVQRLKGSRREEPRSVQVDQAATPISELASERLYFAVFECVFFNVWEIIVVCLRTSSKVCLKLWKIFEYYAFYLQDPYLSWELESCICRLFVVNIVNKIFKKYHTVFWCQCSQYFLVYLSYY